MWDLKTNTDIDSGHCTCHSLLDLVLTPSGDLAVIDGQDELNQRFFLYLAIPQGEFYDPKVGCFAYDYLHEKNTSSNMRRMEQDIQDDLPYQFPELQVHDVTCQQSSTDPFQAKISIKLSNETLQYMYTPEELMTLTSLLTRLVENIY